MMKKLSLFAVLVLVTASPSVAATCGTDHPCKNPAHYEGRQASVSACTNAIGRNRHLAHTKHFYQQ
jgi:hypothetical protein